jgi:hypothetical protein
MLSLFSTDLHLELKMFLPSKSMVRATKLSAMHQTKFLSFHVVIPQITWRAAKELCKFKLNLAERMYDDGVTISAICLTH